MKRLIYIGNKLETRGASPTAIDILTTLLQNEGFKIHTASSEKNQLLRLSDMLRTIAANAGKCDLVLIDTYSTKNFWYAVLSAHLCRIYNLPYIPVLHGGNLGQRLTNNRKISQELFGKAYYNVAPSQYLMKVFNEHGYKNLKYIPNAIPIQNYTFRLRKEIQPKIIWVRAFAEVYNPMLALKILKLLLKDFPGAELYMVGPEKDGSLKVCMDYAEIHHLPVKFPGKLSKEEWLTLASEYDIFLNTSNTDNTPVSVIEAMALGLSVVSTNVGGIPYLIRNREHGLLFKKDNELEAAEAIRFLINSPGDAAKFSSNARRKAEGFDWERVKVEWLELLS